MELLRRFVFLRMGLRGLKIRVIRLPGIRVSGLDILEMLSLLCCTLAKTGRMSLLRYVELIDLLTPSRTAVSPTSGFIGSIFRIVGSTGMKSLPHNYLSPPTK